MYIFKTRKIKRWAWYITLKFEIDEKKLLNNYELLLSKFENDNKIFKVYKDYFIFLNDSLNHDFIEKYKSFIDEYEEEQIKIRRELNSK